MKITMVKKRGADGAPCGKCLQAQATLERRGLLDRITEVVWAVEGEPDSPGMVLGRELSVSLAPFFVIETAAGREVITTVGRFVKWLSQNTDRAAATDATASTDPNAAAVDADKAEVALRNAHPADIMRWGLERYGADLALSFSGAEDVVLIDMASRLGLPFSVFSLDTGRLHPETYAFIDRVRRHYGVELELFSPDAARLEAFVRRKGLFSFYEDGHGECCAVRKVEPLRRALSTRAAWCTGQRRDQSPTRSSLRVIEVDRAFAGRDTTLLKLNPLAHWSSGDVWDYIRSHDVPYNALHEQGFVSIGCAPCTRPPRPGEHERAGRWWWEDATRRECGLHIVPASA